MIALATTVPSRSKPTSISSLVERLRCSESGVRAARSRRGRANCAAPPRHRADAASEPGPRARRLCPRRRWPAGADREREPKPAEDGAAEQRSQCEGGEPDEQPEEREERQQVGPRELLTASTLKRYSRIPDVTAPRATTRARSADGRLRRIRSGENFRHRSRLRSWIAASAGRCWIRRSHRPRVPGARCADADDIVAASSGSIVGTFDQRGSGQASTPPSTRPGSPPRRSIRSRACRRGDGSFVDVGREGGDYRRAEERVVRDRRRRRPLRRE